MRTGHLHPPDYFYCLPHNIRGGQFLIDGEEGAHLVHVMRKQAGDTIRIVDGVGTAYDARIDEVKGKNVKGVIVNRYENHHEPSVHLTVAVGLLKNPSKFDFLVEKTTELGVRAIVPLKTERTIPSHTKTERWQKLALAAMKQAGRSFLPQIGEITGLQDLLDSLPPGTQKYIAHEQPIEPAIASAAEGETGQPVVILIGPEGGFSDGEVATALNAGCMPLYFGERRLRTETAAIIAVSALLLPSVRR
jgi:16S rRNA (uracil1498-N3)-methyltransferase